MTTPGGPSGPGGPKKPEEHTGPQGKKRAVEHETEYYGTEHPTGERATSRVSWGGVFVGVFVTLAVGMAILSLGAALGLSAVDPATADMTALGWGTGIWSIVTIILATFVGAFVSVKASNLRSSRDAGVQGGAVWALSFLMMTLFAGAIAAAGAAVAVAAEPVAPAETIGEVATWGYFVGAALGAISGVLGGLAGYPTEMRAGEEPRKKVRVRERELQPSEA